MTKHGYYHHKHYQRWNGMMTRCYNHNHSQFKDYGGRGVMVSDEWRNSPEAFCKWADNTYVPGLSLDRKNNDLGYSPENCTWSTRRKQNSNQRPHKKTSTLPAGVSAYRERYVSSITVNGKKQHLAVCDTPEEASELFQFAKRQVALYRQDLECQ